MLIGYARVSKTDGQDTASQVDALRAAGCERIFEDRASGARWDRPELHRLLDQLRPGDTVVVWKLDRLSRSLKDLLTILDQIEQAKAGFRSLTEAVDTTGPAGRMLVQMLGAFAEFERSMIRERTRAGLDAARSRGQRSGRRPKLNATQRGEALRMLSEGRPPADVARIFGLHRSTVARLKP
jgi:DNA invertase Pin-like site-specific DNA recombinase